MAKQDGIKGVEKALDGIKAAIMPGVWKAGLIVQAEAQRRVPVEYGNLRASAYTNPHHSKKNTVRVGFGAAYALWVHENLEAKWKGKPRRSGTGVYWGPKGEPKFLERALIAKKDEIKEALRSTVRPHRGSTT